MVAIALRRVPLIGSLILLGLIGSGCRTSCFPQDAEALIPGCAPAGMWRWNGSGCSKLVGCECIGRDCARLYPSEAACVAEHAHCGPSGRTPIQVQPAEGLPPPEGREIPWSG